MLTFAQKNPAGSHPVHRTQPLQRQVKNQAVQRLLREPSGAPVQIQAKLTVNQPGDVYEQEADRVSEQVMRSPEPQLQRAGSASLGQTTAPPIVHDVLRSPGQPLEPGARDFMESRFGRDFSQVRVHTGAMAAASSQSIQALAYTSGNNVVFGAGQYAPGTESGKRLLAHELTHVVQQDGGQESGRISRFSDNDHNAIEEAALTLAQMSPEDIEQIHLGNTKRDYSQSPPLLNLALLCEGNSFGGYSADDHFDNFRWDEALQNFLPRVGAPGPGKKSPIQHIEVELVKFADALPGKEAFQHVGNAFHAVEDFFAHSNFIELTHGDFQHGNELITGSVGSSDDVSLLKILETISSQETAPAYGARANREIAGSPEQSHARMAKDYKSNAYYMEAVVLAGLVIKELGSEVLALKSLTTNKERVKHVQDVIMARVKRYLRPPNESDKWWEELRATGGRTVEKAIREAAAKTPVTKNQCVLSPLRSIEASRDSNLKLLGPAFPVPTKNGHVLVQVGTGFAAGPAFAGPSGEVEPRSPGFLPVGVQVSGRF